MPNLDANNVIKSFKGYLGSDYNPNKKEMEYWAGRNSQELDKALKDSYKTRLSKRGYQQIPNVESMSQYKPDSKINIKGTKEIWGKLAETSANQSEAGANGNAPAPNKSKAKQDTLKEPMKPLEELKAESWGEGISSREDIQEIYLKNFGRKANPDELKHHRERKTPRSRLEKWAKEHPQNVTEKAVKGGASASQYAQWRKTQEEPFDYEAEREKLRKEYGIDEREQAAFEPTRTVENVYTDTYNKYMQTPAVKEAKAQLQKVDESIAQRRQALEQELDETDENPWLTEQGRTKETRKKVEEAQEDINNFASEREVWDNVYTRALQQAENMAAKKAGFAANELSRNQQYLSYLQQRLGSDLSIQQAQRESEIERDAYSQVPDFWQARAEQAAQEAQEILAQSQAEERRDFVRDLKEEYPDVVITENMSDQDIADAVRKSNVFAKDTHIKRESNNDNDDDTDNDLTPFEKADAIINAPQNRNVDYWNLYSAIRDNVPELSISDVKAKLKENKISEPGVSDAPGNFSKEELATWYRDQRENGIGTPKLQDQMRKLGYQQDWREYARKEYEGSVGDMLKGFGSNILQKLNLTE